MKHGKTSAPIRIGVFDSGFGGLTVLRALLPEIPSAEFFYLGDTARLPYGSKSQATVARYAVESAQLLESMARTISSSRATPPALWHWTQSEQQQMFPCWA